MKGEVLSEGVRRDRLAHRFETADQKPAAFVANVEMAVVVRQRGQVARKALHGLCQQVEVLARPYGDLHPGHGAGFAAPQSGAQGHGIASDRAPIGLDCMDLAVTGQDAGHPGVFEDPGTPRLRSLDQRRAQIRRADPSVIRRPDCSHDIVGVHQGPAFPGLLLADGLRAHAEETGQSCLAPDMGHAIRVGGDGKRSHVDPAGLLTGFLSQLRIEFDGVTDQFGQIPCRPQSPHLGSRVPGCA